MEFKELNKWVKDRVEKFEVYLDFRLTHLCVNLSFPNCHQGKITAFEDFLKEDKTFSKNSFDRWNLVINRRKYWKK